MKDKFVKNIILFIFLFYLDTLYSDSLPFKFITYYQEVDYSAVQIQLDSNSKIIYYQYGCHNVEFSYQFKLEDISLNKIIEHFKKVDFEKIDNHYSGDEILDGGLEKLTINLPQKTIEISGLGYEDEPKELKDFRKTLLKCVNKYLGERNKKVLKKMRYNYLLNHKNIIDSMYSPSDTISYYSAVEEMPRLLKDLDLIKTDKCNESNEEGWGIFQLYIDDKGNVQKVEFLKGYGNYCEESAIERLLNTKFEPGKQRGKTVKVKMTMKIYFNQ